jgi:hypothetical protein
MSAKAVGQSTDLCVDRTLVRIVAGDASPATPTKDRLLNAHDPDAG